MTPRDLLFLVIDPVLTILPREMDSKAARAMMVAISLQESGLTERHQIRGPAHGWWQFEPIGVQGVLEHHTTAEYAAGVLTVMDYRPDEVFQAIEDNDVLASAFARLLLWQCPEPLPDGCMDIDEAWKQYLWLWRPGKPRRAEWDQSYRTAWSDM